MKRFMTTAAALALVAGAAQASVMATTATDLNLRAGPGSEFKSVDVMAGGSDVSVNGCLESNEWCSVSYNGQMGWAYGPYLAVPAGEQYVSIDNRPTEITVDTVTYQPEGETDELVAGATAGATMGAIVATAVGGPVGGVIAGGILGAAAGTEVAQPDEETIAYVTANPVDNVILQGEAVVGARVPLDQVTVYDVPGNEDVKYLYLNQTPAIITADSGEIVYLVR